MTLWRAKGYDRTTRPGGLWVLGLALILLWPAQAVGLGDRSVDWFKRDLRRALVVCNDPSLQAASQAAVQKQQLWQLVDHAFQGDVIIPAILRQTWPALTEAEHDRLWPVVNYAIKWKIIGKLFMFHLREVSFTTEGKGDEGYFLDGYLETRLFSHPTRFIFVDRPEGWAAYDVVVDGFSLMEHYRRKFDSTYFTGGLDGLLRQLASEVNDDFQEMGYTPPDGPFSRMDKGSGSGLIMGRSASGPAAAPKEGGPSGTR